MNCFTNKSLEELVALAEHDVNSQLELGWRHFYGLGAEQNDVQAAAWYRKAAEAGDAHAQLILGNFYAAGVGVAQDDAQALEWHLKAAQAGSAQAQFQLASRYAEGTAQDDTLAAQWCLKAAQADHADAQYMMSQFYSLGKGVPCSRKEAMRWRVRAAAQGHEDALDELDLEMLDSILRGKAGVLELMEKIDAFPEN